MNVRLATLPKRVASTISALSLCMAIAVLAGCATSLPTEMPSSAAEVAVKPVYISRFRLSGRLSVRVADRLDSARIEWMRDGRKETISFFSPFGSQIALVSASADGASLTRGEVVEYAPSIRALTESLLGVGIDTEMLARWVQGFDVGEGIAVSNENGERTAQWSIRAENVRSVDGVIGGRIAARVSAAEGDRSLRLFVDSFTPIFSAP
jgi:outer membrane biogenesis lipoprotein LolB